MLLTNSNNFELLRIIISVTFAKEFFIFEKLTKSQEVSVTMPCFFFDRSYFAVTQIYWAKFIYDRFQSLLAIDSLVLDKTRRPNNIIKYKKSRRSLNFSIVVFVKKRVESSGKET